ncbi:dihydrolipoamide acetyltransferase family protein [Parahaliea mediterranea]|uniref:Dihydrolipoamide acetyltransferase component of pyruvate dehydrogenase complex n=1 Tax=Parahaliea mediterranea TaxID=651086 RepID=A0A939DHT6_9GAMM|nr:dihydrolipoamide acetyltransferase family protein [Parahaliea mediterranea]MBN7798590.1 2-oxo acid dehydrogenase subunit E2 [Parahaliea mediterranea]
MGVYSFKLPDLGEGIVESEVSTWHVSVGDMVCEDDPLADVQTDKAVVEVSAPVAGRIVALGCSAGEVLAVGAELVCFDIDGDGPGAEGTAARPEPGGEAPIAAPPAKYAGATPFPATDPVFQQVLASPSLRKRAREAGINLADVPGSGPKGRISHRDFEAFLAAGGELASRPGESRQATREVRLSGMRRVIARKMQESKRNIPHYSYIEEVDVTELEALRQHLNTEREDGQAKLTLLPFLVLALVKILPRFPHCNARFDDVEQVLTEFDAVHVGVATMTEAGLMVPVVRHCESLDVWRVASAIGRVSALARDGKAAPADLGGSTITITSLGAIGGIATTPVINAPETTIIGVNKMQERPVVRGGNIVARTMMNLSASFDHRIVDGYDGAQLVQALKASLEHPGAIFV